ncbi:MAG: hypothetical protein ACJAVN_001816 [Roseivirga sp.]|jgi:hypothetical protein
MAVILVGTGKVNRLQNLSIISIIASMLMLVACNSSIKTNEEASLMTNNDKDTVFSMIIDHPDLQQYFHENEKNRVPLKVKSNKDLGINLSVIKFGKIVEFYLNTDFESTSPLFEVILFKTNTNHVTFDILYAVEGISIKGELKKQDSQWLFVEFEVFEG